MLKEQDIENEVRKVNMRFMERDLIVLRWIGEQHAVRFDHLQELLSRYSSNGYAKGARLHRSRIYQHINRWKSEKLIESKVMRGHGKSWFWLTHKGLTTVELEFKYKELAFSKVNHTHAVNSVRLWLEERLSGGQYLPYKRIDWMSEREVNRDRRQRGRKHIVDGALFYNDTWVGIEVELTPKHSWRLESIIEELQEDYENIWYFSLPEAEDAVRLAVKNVGLKLKEDLEDYFVFYQLSDILGDDRLDR